MPSSKARTRARALKKEQDHKNMVAVGNVPFDIWIIVMKILSAEDRISLGLTCKYMYNYVLSEVTIKRYNARTSKRVISKVVTGFGIFPRIISNPISLNLTGTLIDGKEFELIMKSFPSLRYLNIIDCNKIHMSDILVIASRVSKLRKYNLLVDVERCKTEKKEYPKHIIKDNLRYLYSEREVKILSMIFNSHEDIVCGDEKKILCCIKCGVTICKDCKYSRYETDVELVKYKPFRMMKHWILERDPVKI
jgi:hypothetical protein